MSRPARAVAGTVLAAFVLGACANTSGSLAHQVAQWTSAAGLAANDAQIAADLQEIAAGRHAGALAQVRVSCAGLQVDAGTAYGELPTPDAALTAALDASYRAYARAGQACATVRTGTGAAFSRYDARRAAGDAALARARRRLRALGVG